MNNPHNEALEAVRYPVGRFDRSTRSGGEGRSALLKSIAELPHAVRLIVTSLSEADLARRYRAGGWTVRQIVHHLADSHINGYTRMKLALSEDVPTIKPYDQARWAELPDSHGPLDSSLDLLDALHRRWADLLHRLSEEDSCREFRHPESGLMTIAVAIALYEWHGRHHTAHLHNAVRSR